MEMVIFVGLQGAGKSTFYRERFMEKEYEYISKDAMNGSSGRDRRQQQMIEAALSAGRSVVIDNTNTTREARRALIEQGRRHGAEINCYYFALPLKICLDRNRQRSGKARVPDIALYSAHKKLVVPTCAEGFDKLFCISEDEEGRRAVVDETCAEKE